MSQQSKYISFLIGIVVFALATQLIFFGSPIQKDGDRRMAPLFSASFGDRQIDLHDVVGQKIILVNFWATWCPPCREEVPLLNQLVQKVASDDFMIVAVMEDNKAMNDGERRAELNEFRKKIPINYPVFADADGRISESYGTYQLPESYLIDATGAIIDKQVGSYSPRQIEALAQKIKSEIRKL